MCITGGGLTQTLHLGAALCWVWDDLRDHPGSYGSQLLLLPPTTFLAIQLLYSPARDLKKAEKVTFSAFFSSLKELFIRINSSGHHYSQG